MNGLQALLVNFPDAPVVVWLNECFGKVEMEGDSVEDSKVVQNILKKSMPLYVSQNSINPPLAIISPACSRSENLSGSHLITRI